MKLDFFILFLQSGAAALSVFIYNKYKTKFLFLLMLFLGVTAVTEVYANYVKSKGGSSLNYYHLYVFIAFFLVSLIYLNIIKDRKKKKVFYFFGIGYILFWITIFFRRELFSYLIIFGNLLVSIYILLYLRELLLSDKILNYKKLPSFWVSVGFLIFYMSSIPFFTFYKYMIDRDLFFVLHVLIIIMNLFIIYGLTCSEKEVKY
ncbi:hypothetical protein ACIVBQ_001809 [Tenacibaculum discolor]